MDVPLHQLKEKPVQRGMGKQSADVLLLQFQEDMVEVNVEKQNVDVPVLV